MDYNLLIDGIWYGEISKSKQRDFYLSQIKQEFNYKRKLSLVLDLLKLGDFTAKIHLINIIKNCSDDAVIVEALRLLFLVSTGDDLDIINDIVYKSELNVVNTIALYAPLLLSIEIVPYLLALIENFTGTEVEMIE